MGKKKLYTMREGFNKRNKKLKRYELICLHHPLHPVFSFISSLILSTGKYSSLKIEKGLETRKSARFL